MSCFENKVVTEDTSFSFVAPYPEFKISFLVLLEGELRCFLLLTHDDDYDIYELQAKASIIYFEIQASTFNPYESSSSTERYLKTKQKERKVKAKKLLQQKVKVIKLEPNNQDAMFCWCPLSYPRPPSMK